MNGTDAASGGGPEQSGAGSEGGGSAATGSDGGRRTNNGSASGASSGDPKRLVSVTANIMVVFLLIIAVIFLVILGWGLFSGPLLDRLASNDGARGVVTFFFAVGTVAIAVIITLSALVSTDNLSLEKRLGFAREVLAVMIGILGTIVGFYFGTASGGGPAAPLTVADFYVSDSSPVAGENITVVGRIHGGVAPYNYSILFDPKGVGATDVENKSTDDGYFRIAVPIAKDAKGGEVTAGVEVTDAHGIKAVHRSPASEAITIKTKSSALEVVSADCCTRRNTMN